MIFRIAWLNIWRSRTRSLVVIAALAVGVWAIIFLSGFNSGIAVSYIEKVIKNEISHVQIHNPAYKEDREVKYTIPESEALLAVLNDNEYVEKTTLRTIATGMISSSRASRGVMIRGIDPQGESAVTGIQKSLTEGSFFDGKRKTGILISQRLADKLRVNIRKKVSLRFQDSENNLVDVGFRVVGIFDTKNRAYDENNVFVLKEVINENLDMGNIAHEAAIVLKDINQVDTFQALMKAAYPSLLIENYKEIAPEIDLFNTQIQITSTIVTFIVMLGLIFGIINTMLMSVLERFRELGMLMAIGMNKIRIFSMIVLETLMLGTIGAPFGMLLGYLTITYLRKTGIDLSNWSQGMQEYGISDKVYPYLADGTYLQLTTAVFITAFLASIYPALKAINLRPVEAIRKI